MPQENLIGQELSQEDLVEIQQSNRRLMNQQIRDEVINNTTLGFFNGLGELVYSPVKLLSGICQLPTSFCQKIESTEKTEQKATWEIHPLSAFFIFLTVVGGIALPISVGIWMKLGSDNQTRQIQICKRLGHSVVPSTSPNAVQEFPLGNSCTGNIYPLGGEN